jgi:DNA polymerase
MILGGHPVYAHNVGFERAVWHHVCHQRMGWLDVPFGQWRCSLAACSRLALPRGLDDAAKALKLAVRKDKDGHKLMLKMCKPKRDGTWHEDAHDLRRLYDYCRQDVDAEVALHEATGPLTPSELRVWQLDQRTNMRGLPIDRKAVEEALDIVRQCGERNCDRLIMITNGVVDSPKRVAALRKWLAEQGTDLPDLSAETVSEALSGSLSDPVREALEIRKLSAKASTAKLKAMLQRSDRDDRVRGNVIYHGAATGRWAGVGLQVQNFPRGNMDQAGISQAHELFPLRDPRAIELVFGSPLDTISSCLRSFICAPPGRRLLVCDFASIEARVLAWIAGQSELVRAFRAGIDVYKGLASTIYDVPIEEVTKTQRFVGKTAVLGLGYGMGHRAFKLACKTMASVDIDTKMAKHVVKTYRDGNDRIKAFWMELNTAAIRTIETGKPHVVRKLTLTRNEDWLMIKLPSGRKLHYNSPKVEMVIAPWSKGHHGFIYSGDPAVEELAEEHDVTLGAYDDGVYSDCDFPQGTAKKFVEKGYKLVVEKKEPKLIPQVTYMSVSSYSRKWSKTRSYGGKLTENVVQACARDFLAEAMLRVEKRGYPIIATIHDEIVAERKEGEGTMDEFEHIMSEVPAWGAGCPIGVEGFEARRYRK